VETAVSPSPLASLDSRRQAAVKVTTAYGIGKLHTELTRALSAWLSVGNRIPGARCPKLALKSAFGAKRKKFPLLDPR
jgi:hypothetical protein